MWIFVFLPGCLYDSFFGPYSSVTSRRYISVWPYCINFSWNMIYFFDLQTKAIISELFSSILDLSIFFFSSSCLVLPTNPAPGKHVNNALVISLYLCSISIIIYTQFEVIVLFLVFCELQNSINIFLTLCVCVHAWTLI